MTHVSILDINNVLVEIDISLHLRISVLRSSNVIIVPPFRIVKLHVNILIRSNLAHTTLVLLVATNYRHVTSLPVDVTCIRILVNVIHIISIPSNTITVVTTLREAAAELSQAIAAGLLRNILTEQHVPSVNVTVVVNLTIERCRNTEYTVLRNGQLNVCLIISIRHCSSVTILRSDDVLSQTYTTRLLVTVDHSLCSNLVVLRSEEVLSMTAINILRTFSLSQSELVTNKRRAHLVSPTLILNSADSSITRSHDVEDNT